MTAAITVLTRLQNWYQSQCDGDWEHTFGIKVETLDNPGWMLTIDLNETAWGQLEVPSKILERSETDWVRSEVTRGRSKGPMASVRMATSARPIAARRPLR